VSLAIRETRLRASRFGLAHRTHETPANFQKAIRKDIEMRRLSTPCSFLIATFAVTSLPAVMGAQGESLTTMNTTNQSVDALGARPETSETRCCKSVISNGQPILQPGTLRGPGQTLVKSWAIPSIPSYTPSANRKSWIGAGPGALPFAVAVQPDVTQKYGTNPGVLQLYFGHRP
jgi:hypothetical protein